MTVLSLETACTQLRGVGKNLGQLLAKLDIYTLQDLLFHLPLRYQDRTHITPISNIRVGDECLIQGIITSRQTLFKPRMQCLLQITEGTGVCYVRMFHFTKSQLAKLQVGTRIQCFGEVRLGRKGIEFIHPEYRVLEHEEIPTVSHTLTPIYPSTEGIGQTTWRRLTDQALAALAHAATTIELLPVSLRERFGLSDLAQALIYVHRPPPDASQQILLEGKHPMQKRLVFEELLAHQLCLRLFRQKVQQLKAPALPATENYISPFITALPFALTAAQQRVFTEAAQDMQKTIPMLRLVQGDVGSGKTVVAALTALLAVENGWQAALMAPTEILAEQHYHNFSRWLTPLGITVSWLTGKSSGKNRATTLANIAAGHAHIIIGTHALFQKDVEFKSLGVVIVDEQHRFGVEQRLALRNKSQPSGLFPHQLIMTATPIPRTLAMTAYADLDISIIDELPPGRKPVTTIAVSNQRRDDIIARIQQVCAQGNQVYWVCTLIDESEILICQAAESTAQLLQEALGDAIKVGLVHGRLTPTAKDNVMQAFKAGDINVLVATTVIEVGVDVPNASLMVIENPERLGLSQLHQLRGRVGRGNLESYCVLLYQAPLSQMAKERLGAMRETNDGFIIAERDLALRGPGEMLGTRQTGEMQLHIADLQRDVNLLPTVQQAATTLLEQFPTMVQPLISRWIGKAEQYGMV
jgi:ATP-dependent DNA helicase RecG